MLNSLAAEGRSPLRALNWELLRNTRVLVVGWGGGGWGRGQGGGEAYSTPRMVNMRKVYTLYHEEPQML